MVDLEEIHNLELDVIEFENHTLALKSFVLFSSINDIDVICISKEHISLSFDYLSKQSFELEIVFFK